MKNKILWIDDEIELLRSNILFLEDKGYNVDKATNGEDAIEMVKKKDYNLIFLDEMMAGMGGLKTLAILKDVQPNIPVVMVTKNETESLMEDAIGAKISDYLLKPVNPNQILLVLKKFLEGRRIKGETLSRDYIQEFNRISAEMMGDLDYRDWININQEMTQWEMELDEHPELGLKETLYAQRKECNAEFCRFFERNYLEWIHQKKPGPIFSNQVIESYVVPELENTKSVFFFVIDCLRLDQWMLMERKLYDYFKISKEFYYGMIPSATPYARNAIFSGLFPSEIEKYYPDLWAKGEDDENSKNNNEKEFLEKLLQRKRVKLRNDLKYVKILEADFGKGIESKISTFSNNHLNAIVVNFVDILAHSRSDNAVLKEIAPDEAAYRSLTDSWFEHSTLFSMFKILSAQKDIKIIVTTDHGSIRCLRGAKVLGDKETSTNLRYKYGRNVKSDDRQAIFIRNPLDYKLPRRGGIVNYVITKEDFYFVYPTDYHYYLNHYKNTFQHGGISMEELILPVITLDPKE
ncbi:MAG: PglZ domain-containing protein [Ignavibacteriae bacterium]|nr:MAG: PglZ domain-containing protein [Ignavibacteriota bacterium]